LEHHLEHVPVDRRKEFGRESQGGRPGDGARVVDPYALPVALCPIHGGIGTAKQVRGCEAVLGMRRRADARSDEARCPVDFDRARESLSQPMCDSAHVVGLAQVTQDHRELVSTQARRSVVLEHVGVQANCDLAEHEVALVMAERVVDMLEPVEVDHEDGNRISSGPRSIQRDVERFFERFAVGETGEMVEARGPPQGGLLAPQYEESDGEKKNSHESRCHPCPHRDEARARCCPFDDVPVVCVAHRAIDDRVGSWMVPDRASTCRGRLG
jgi:hypothetical protein